MSQNSFKSFKHASLYILLSKNQHNPTNRIEQC